ncbi:hypothetical protein ACE6H2_001020 [Prunus campanulata]
MFLNFPRANVRVVGLAYIVWRGFFIREPGGGEVTMVSGILMCPFSGFIMFFTTPPFY